MEDQKKKYSNIFEAASSAAKKQEAAPPIEKKPVSSIEEINERFARCKKLYELLADTVQSMLAKKQTSLEKLKAYFDNPANFSDANWRLIQQEKKMLEAKLNDLAAKKLVPKASEEKPKTERKPKSMQAKSRWMPMR
jgi:hypothetical protein